MQPVDRRWLRGANVRWRLSVVASLALFASLALLGFGCANGVGPPNVRPPSPISVEASDLDLSGPIGTIRVESAPASPRSDDLESGATALEERAAALLRQRGFEAARAGDATSTFELDQRVERVRKRSWSSDPDASGARLVERSEAVLTLRLRRGEDRQEAWRCEARMLVDAELREGRSLAPAFDRLLEVALRRLPPSR